MCEEVAVQKGEHGAVKESKSRKLFYKRIAMIMTIVAVSVVMMAFPVFADVGTPGSTQLASNTMTKLISLMCSMFKYVGIALFVWAIIQFILATKRSDADSKADAIQTAVCGVALIGVGVVVKALNLDNINNDEISDNFLE